MIFYGLDRNNIIDSSKLEGDFYKYELGNKVEVTALKKNHVNSILARNLSSQVKEDKMMLRYYPTNEVFFRRDFVESSSSKNFASCLVSKESCSAFIGGTENYPINTGILAFSGVLSLNNMIESERIILCNSQMDDYARKKIRILACGMRGDKLLALYYIPSERGLALSCDSGSMCISAKSLMYKSYNSWDTFTLSDWFEGVRIKEMEV